MTAGVCEAQESNDHKCMNKWVKRTLLVAGVAVTAVAVPVGMNAWRDRTNCGAEEVAAEPAQFKEFQSPTGYSVPYRELALNGTSGSKLKGWVFKANYNKPTIVYMYGGSSDVAWAMPQLIELYRESGCNLVVVNYSKGGLAPHHQDHADAVDDVSMALSQIKTMLTDTVDTSKVFLMGEGIGANIAVEVASKNQDSVSGMILENPRQAHPGSMVRSPCIDKSPFCYIVPSWLRNCLTTVKPSAQETVKTLSLPTMYYTSHADSVDNAVNWFRFCNSKDVVLLRGADGADRQRAWHEAIAQFADSIVAKEPIGVQIRNFLPTATSAVSA